MAQKTVSETPAEASVCDWYASHYVKFIIDQTFGSNNFQNEIPCKKSFLMEVGRIK
jgi:hypothetical protein